MSHAFSSVQPALMTSCCLFNIQRPCTSANGVRGDKTHGAWRVRLRLRGRPHPPAEPRVAQHLRDLAPSGAGLHGRCGGHEGRPRTYQDIAVCTTGEENI